MEKKDDKKQLKHLKRSSAKNVEIVEVPKNAGVMNVAIYRSG